MSTKREIRDILINEQNLQFEDEVARNPYYLKAWLRYLEFRKAAPTTEKYAIYERALKYLPRSYKLWYSYLSLRSSRLSHACVTDKRFTRLINIFELSLVHMNKMPVIWYDVF